MSGWLYVQVSVYIFFPFPTQWFATILSATEMTKLGHNNPFLFTVGPILQISCSWKFKFLSSDVMTAKSRHKPHKMLLPYKVSQTSAFFCLACVPYSFKQRLYPEFSERNSSHPCRHAHARTQLSFVVTITSANTCTFEELHHCKKLWWVMLTKHGLSELHLLLVTWDSTQSRLRQEVTRSWILQLNCRHLCCCTMILMTVFIVLINIITILRSILGMTSSEIHIS